MTIYFLNREEDLVVDEAVEVAEVVDAGEAEVVVEAAVVASERNSSQIITPIPTRKIFANYFWVV